MPEMTLSITPICLASLCHGVRSAQLSRLSLSSLALQFSFLLELKPVPASQCPWIQSELHEDMVHAGWSERTRAACTKPLTPTTDCAASPHTPTSASGLTNLGRVAEGSRIVKMYRDESRARKVLLIIKAKEGVNLGEDVQKEHMDMMVWCVLCITSQKFAHILLAWSFMIFISFYVVKQCWSHVEQLILTCICYFCSLKLQLESWLVLYLYKPYKWFKGPAPFRRESDPVLLVIAVIDLQRGGRFRALFKKMNSHQYELQPQDLIFYNQQSRATLCEADKPRPQLPRNRKPGLD